MGIIPTRTNKFNKLQKLFSEVAFADRDKLICWAVTDQGYSLQEVADVIGVSKQAVHHIVKKSDHAYGNN